MDREEQSVLVNEAADTLPKIVEALLFASDSPLSVQKLGTLIDDAAPPVIREALSHLAERYDREGRAFQLVQVAGGYQLCTRPRYAHWVERLFKGRQKSRLSNPALETLAIVAYRQPIPKAEIAEIRGVDVDGVLRTLLERNLVTVVGRKDTPGRPLLFGTTKEFLTHFGINLIQDLPSIEEMEELVREKNLSGAGPGRLVGDEARLETESSEVKPSETDSSD
jgi:segregation and condensation protein B